MVESLTYKTRSVEELSVTIDLLVLQWISVALLVTGILFALWRYTESVAWLLRILSMIYLCGGWLSAVGIIIGRYEDVATWLFLMWAIDFVCWISYSAWTRYERQKEWNESRRKQQRVKAFRKGMVKTLRVPRKR